MYWESLNHAAEIITPEEGLPVGQATYSQSANRKKMSLL